MTRYVGDRPNLLRFTDVRDRRVLDVGCGEGGLAVHLRRAGAQCVVGIELDEGQAACATSTCDEVLAGTVEQVLEQGQLGIRRFDLIVLADVLEHLVDPWRVLRELVSHHLEPGGHVLTSVPNVANWAVAIQVIVRRDWRYEPSGMFDRTHLRWFGAETLNSMLSQAGLVPIVRGGTIDIGVRRFRLQRDVSDVTRWPRVTVFSFHTLSRLAIDEEPASPSPRSYDRRT